MLCESRAACVAEDVAANGSSWRDWTGYDDQSAYQAACMTAFQDSFDGGATRNDLQGLCRAEQSNVCE
jgi:hypothetical protein